MYGARKAQAALPPATCGPAIVPPRRRRDFTAAPSDASRWLVRWLLTLARLIPVAVIIIAGFAATGRPLRLLMPPGTEPRDVLMVGIAALGYVGLAAAILARSFRLSRLTSLLAGTIATLAFGVLLSHVVLGSDRFSPWLGQHLFGWPGNRQPGVRTGAALCLLLLCCAQFESRRGRTQLRDTLAGTCIVVAGLRVLGWVYDIDDEYIIPIFDSMALQTAATFLLLAIASVLADPRAGWAATVASLQPGGATTRPQLLFSIVPVLTGWALLLAVKAQWISAAAAIALLVMSTVAPLTLLVLRDGRVLNALYAERRAKAELQARYARELERRLEEQAARLGHETLERLKAEAAMFNAQRMEAVGQLTGGVAHDFNNLLMAISGNLELLMRQLPASGPARRHAEQAASAADKGAKVIGQLLAFSRTQQLEIRPVALDPVIDAAIELIANALSPSILVQRESSTQGLWVRTDPDQLELALLNLALNARDAMPHGGVLTIRSAPLRTRLPGSDGEIEMLSIQVADTGEGMSPEVLARACEPFFTTKERGKGTGLGLAQVYGIVRQCEGDVRLSSEPGRGSTVELLLRCAAAAPHTGSLVTSAEPAVPAQAPQQQCLLVIDDDDAVRSLLADALRLSGYEVIEAGDGLSGLAQLDRTMPDAAIIDFLMPGINGAEIARRLRERRPGLPVVFVSGYSDTAALNAVGDAVVLRKPFDIESLRAAVAQVLHAA